MFHVLLNTQHPEALPRMDRYLGGWTTRREALDHAIEERVNHIDYVYSGALIDDRHCGAEDRALIERLGGTV